ncbi:hypothetical protein OG401_21130 [Kitasatospora purpeofusca]|uniref:MarR family transcriptional regulator n=1 Tax=Kitasatospora purpeofusca TaxID=67352 RepID=UPI0022543A18|nr:MarR family transcriptional regulator [Kitasatospora purpeofusca]MCX4686785.1 hypothetical protein [Kitasatospora purpeofusca]
MPRQTAAAVQPDPPTATGQTPAPDSPFVTRFPARWLPLATGDTLRAVTAVGDYARGRAGYCWAADRTLAAGLSLHPRTVAAALRTAESLGMIRAVQRPGGTSARILGDVAEDELMVCISAYARNTLPGSQFLAYSVLAVREHLGERTSMARISTMAGISPGTARAAVAKLVAAGWITREDVAGGAARYAVHPAPVPGIPTQPPFAEPRRRAARTAPAVVESLGECPGQLALDLDAPEPTPPDLAPTTPVDPAPATPAGSVPRTGSSQQDLVNKPSAVGGCGSGVADTPVPRVTGAAASTRDGAVRPGRASAAPERPTTLPPLLITAATHRVLAQVPGLVQRMRRWEQREAARAVGAAIEDAGGVERVADRVARRWATADPDEVRRPYGWLVRRGLVRRGCAEPGCESGWDTARDADCRGCEQRVQDARDTAALHRAQQRAPRPPAPARLPAPRPASCPNHPATSLPCALCASAAAVPAPEPDTTSGRALREELAARRHARETAADQTWAARHGIAWTA